MKPRPRKALGFTFPFRRLAALSLAFVVFHPGLNADWGRDDYMQLAIARLVESPWVFFFTDHFPMPNSVFRPLGFVSFWLGQEIAGTNYWGHALLTFGLFAAIGLVLNSLMLRFGVKPVVAITATLLFVLHPIAIGTALWWSARFDLLAVFFVLLALHQSRLAQIRTSKRRVVGALLSLLAATLSKEIGLIGAAAMFVIWQHWAWTRREDFRFAQMTSLLCVLTAFGFLAWRAQVLGSAGSGIAAGTNVLAGLWEGMTRWFALAPGYLSFHEQLGWPAWLLIVALILAGFSFWPLREKASGSSFLSSAQLPLLLMGLLLLLLPAVLQAPVVRLNAIALSSEISFVEAAMQSRLYFMSLAGLCIIASVVLDRAVVRTRRLQSLAPLLAPLVVITFFGLGSHTQATAFADTTRANARLAHDVLDYAEATGWRKEPCHLVFENINPPPEWSIYVSLDSVIKALHPNLEDIDHCFIHANYPTFYHLISSEHAQTDASPFNPPTYDGIVLERRVIGGLTIVYLDPINTLDRAEQDGLRKWQVNQTTK